MGTKIGLAEHIYFVIFCAGCLLELFQKFISFGDTILPLLLTLDFIAEEILTSKRAVGSLRVFEATSKEAATLLGLNVHWGRCDQIIL